MRVYSFSSARQQLSAVLNEAMASGAVYITRKDGTRFVIKPEQQDASPLDVPAVEATSLSLRDILDAVRDSREPR